MWGAACLAPRCLLAPSWPRVSPPSLYPTPNTCISPLVTGSSVKTSLPDSREPLAQPPFPQCPPSRPSVAVTLTYDTNVPNAAACLRDIELRYPCTGALRGCTPLFADRAGGPYSHGFLGSLLNSALTFLYGSAVASLYTFHSYRSGLATALHAAGVSDAMIQLICRWMCPESLHVYRRIGTQEHEGSIRRAAAVDVDALQTVNAPKVSADAGFAELVSQLQGARGALAQKEFEAARQQLMHAPADGAGAPAPAQHPPVRPPHAHGLSALNVGDSAFIPRECWPGEPCDEHGGAGWTVTILALTRHTAMVKFPHARTPSGAPYAPVRVQLQVLRTLA
ncbi:hypothetical protein AB1Y20_007721 [Prymnesium parvum]|uniref:Uncharacterized protein n=1 Tax=Prymnesium parvum TaxID=97485 RepID=A0AB34IYH0_PRYPA